jgi:hypothetical protein
MGRKLSDMYMCGNLHGRITKLCYPNAGKYDGDHSGIIIRTYTLRSTSHG